MAYYGLNYQQAQAQRRDKAAFGIILTVICLVVGALWVGVFSYVEKLGLSEAQAHAVKFWIVVAPVVLLVYLICR